MSRLIRLCETDDDYHECRRVRHGVLYLVHERFRPGDYLLEARSVATGVICTLAGEYVEFADDAI